MVIVPRQLPVLCISSLPFMNHRIKTEKNHTEEKGGSLIGNKTRSQAIYGCR